jgi:hypothetical protein
MEERQTHGLYFFELRVRPPDRDPHDQRHPHADPHLTMWAHW